MLAGGIQWVMGMGVGHVETVPLEDHLAVETELGRANAVDQGGRVAKWPKTRQ